METDRQRPLDDRELEIARRAYMLGQFDYDPLEGPAGEPSDCQLQRLAPHMEVTIGANERALLRGLAALTRAVSSMAPPALAGAIFLAAASARIDGR